MITTNNYELRHREPKGHNRAKSFPVHREVLTPSKSASLVQDPGHNCSEMNVDHIVIKVACRLFHSIFRFSYAYGLNCKTSRGRTYQNGAQSHCGGACHAAHAALSPTLCDDKLIVLAQKLGQGGFDSLDLFDQKYLSRRFKLTESDIALLSSDNCGIRTTHFEKILSRLTPREREGTYIGTPTGFMRNGTCDINASSNRVDIFLEKHLRDFEDKLAKLCQEEALTPVTALEELQKEYRLLIEKAVESLTIKKSSLKILINSYKALVSANPESLEDYLMKIDTYLKAFDDFFDKMPGAPGLKTFKRELTHGPSIWKLKAIQKHNVLADSSHLKPLENADILFKDVEDEISRRLIEAESQLKVLQQTSDEIKTMYKNLFPTQAADGAFITPQKDHIQQHLLDLIVPVTPTRSDSRK